MDKPHYRMAADTAVALGDIGPVGVLFQPEKYTWRALVCTIGKHNLVTFTESGIHKSNAVHVGLGSKLRFVYKPRLVELGFRFFFFTRFPGRLPLRGFLIVEPLRFQNRVLSRTFQPLQDANQPVGRPVQRTDQVEPVLRILPLRYEIFLIPVTPPRDPRRNGWLCGHTVRSEEHTSELQSPSFISYA